MRLLLVGNDEMLADTLASVLRRACYEIDRVVDQVAAERLLRLRIYDLVPVDLGRLESAAMKEINTYRGIIGSSALLIIRDSDGAEDYLRDFDAKTADCLSKPFDIDEVEMRVRTLLSRRAGHGQRVLTHGTLMFDVESREVSENGTPLTLATCEFELPCASIEPPRHFGEDYVRVGVVERRTFSCGGSWISYAWANGRRMAESRAARFSVREPTCQPDDVFDRIANLWLEAARNAHRLPLTRSASQMEVIDFSSFLQWPFVRVFRQIAFGSRRAPNTPLSAQEPRGRLAFGFLQHVGCSFASATQLLAHQVLDVFIARSDCILDLYRLVKRHAHPTPRDIAIRRRRRTGPIKLACVACSVRLSASVITIE
ncbi:MAG: family transcriptional regulator [Caballeronia mineralivorans]|nr:family transcriptional regulator [Caballeronia mineralivorans]MEA3104942.1 two-component system, OmpR family, response regulator QseB [Caballeronia mineralivorans]